MTNTEILRKKIKDSGLKYSHIAERLSLSRNGLKKKIDNESEFRSSEILMLSEILNIGSLEEREAIFFKQ